MDKDIKIAIENDFKELFSKQNDNVLKSEMKLAKKENTEIDYKRIVAELDEILGKENALNKAAKKQKERKPHEGHRKRVYQKVENGAFEYFQDYEIVEMILFSAYARCDTKPQAKKLISHFGNLKNLLDASRYEITALGFPEKVATVLQIYRGVITRYLRQLYNLDLHIDTREKAKQYMYAMFVGKKVECVCCVYMDSRNKIIGVPTHIEGNTEFVMVYVEEIIREASSRRAKYILIGHNHPSGILVPSRNDIELLEEINRGIRPSRCYFYDAIITSDTGYISLAEEGYFRNNEFSHIATETEVNELE